MHKESNLYQTDQNLIKVTLYTICTKINLEILTTAFPNPGLPQ